MSERRRFAMGELRALLEDISKGMDREVVVYVIGGLAMMHYGAKATTKDVDIVFRDGPDEREFEAALTSRGFRRVIDLTGHDLGAGARTVLERDDGARFDLFIERVGRKLRLTEGMRGRATAMDLEGMLRMMILAPEGLFMLKSVTEREDDLSDMALLSGMDLDLGAMVDELRSDEVNYRYLPHLAARVEELMTTHGIDMPGRHRLMAEAEVVAAMNILEERMCHAPITLSDASSTLGEGDGFSRSVLSRMVELGIASERDGKFHRQDAAG